MNRNLIATILLITFFNVLLTTVTCEPNLRRSCGTDLINRVAKICEQRGGYYHLEYVRRKRNIIMECCENACDDMHLYWYCAGKSEKSDYEVNGELFI